MNHSLSSSSSIWGALNNRFFFLNREYLFSIGIITTGFLLLPFFPALSNLVAILCLILSMHGQAARGFIFITVFLFVFSLGINAASYQQFLYHESDFTSYYNNFLTFDEWFKGDWFVYSGGVEVGLPFINFILSFIVDEKPYLFLIAHLLIQIGLLIYLAKLIKEKFALSLFEFGVLLGFLFAFYKYLGMLNHMRQGYSSVFILIALYSSGKRKNAFIFIACLFHISTFLVYPLARLIYISKDIGRKKHLVYLSIPAAFIFFFAFDFFGQLSSMDNFLMEKLVFTFREREGVSAYISSFFYSLIKIFYLLPLLILNEFYSDKDDKQNLRLSMLAIIVPILALSFLPSFVSRLYEFVLVTSLGLLYFYFYINCKAQGRLIARSVVIGFLLILNFRWFMLDNSFYARYPLFSSEPFYYFDSLIEESSRISRFDLPALEDVDK